MASEVGAFPPPPSPVRVVSAFWIVALASFDAAVLLLLFLFLLLLLMLLLLFVFSLGVSAVADASSPRAAPGVVVDVVSEVTLTAVGERVGFSSTVPPTTPPRHCSRSFQFSRYGY